MIVEQIPITGDRNFAYLIGDAESGDAALVDPGSDAERLVARAHELGLRIRWVLHTHGHADHTAGTPAVCRLTGAKLAAYGRGDRALADGDRLPIGDAEIHVLYTPGHTQDSVCYLVEGNLFTGDTLFVGKVGGTGDTHAARQEYDALHGKICALPPETIVWPGHNYGVRPSSTVGDEMRTNPFLLRTSFEEFIDLKANWAEYKRQHGIS